MTAAMNEIVRALFLFVLGTLFGFALLVALFRARVLGGMDVLFYRGVVLIGVCAIITLLGGLWLAPRLGLRSTDALAAVVMSASINLSFLVILPVTIDRSITVFLLGYMDARPDVTFSADDLKQEFSERYLGQYHQIDRRITEQLISSNVVRVGDRYKISPQGRAFIAFSRVIVQMFDIDPRFVAPAAPSAAAKKP